MDNHYDNEQRPEPPQSSDNRPFYTDTRSNGLATASLVLSLIGAATICCIYGPFILGGLSIILGLLSRRAGQKLMTSAKAGVIISAVSILVSAAVLIISAVTLFSSYSSMDDFMRDYQYYYESIYGEDNSPFDTDMFDFPEPEPEKTPYKTL